MRSLPVVLLVAACSAPSRPPPDPLPIQPHPRPTVTAPPWQSRVAKLKATGDPADRVRAVELLETACASERDMHACDELSVELDRGIFVDKDEVRAAKLRADACDAKLVEACYVLGMQYERGDNAVAMDRTKANELFARACELEHSWSCGLLARNTHNRELYQRAFDLSLLACERGGHQSCVAAEQQRKQPGVSGDINADAWKQARANLEARCANKDAEGCSLLASAFDDGAGGLPADPVRAVELRVRACELGYVHACAMAGYAYRDGRTVPKNASRSQQMHERACKLGDGGSCSRVSEAIKTGDPTRSLALDRRACDLGHTTGCNRALTVLVQTDRADPAQAALVRARMCGLGHTDVCAALAEETERMGDTKLAQQQYARACNAGDTWRGCGGELRMLKQACAAGDQTACSAQTARVAALPANKRDLALYGCCNDPKVPPPTPIAAVLRLADAIRNRDKAAIAELVHPTKGMTVRAGWHGDAHSAAVAAGTITGSGELVFSVRAKSVDMTKLASVTIASFGANSLDCGSVSGGVASCRVYEGGFQGTYTVAIIGTRAYVTSINEDSH